MPLAALPPRLTSNRGYPLVRIRSARRTLLFRSSIPGLRVPLSNASAAVSPPPPHSSGPGWFARPFPYDSFIRNSMPVYPGAFSDPGSPSSLGHSRRVQFRANRNREEEPVTEPGRITEKQERYHAKRHLTFIGTSDPGFLKVRLSSSIPVSWYYGAMVRSVSGAQLCKWRRAASLASEFGYSLTIRVKVVIHSSLFWRMRCNRAQFSSTLSARGM